MEDGDGGSYREREWTSPRSDPAEGATGGTTESAARLRQLIEVDNDERFALAISLADTGSQPDVIEMMRERAADEAVDNPSTGSGLDAKKE